MGEVTQMAEALGASIAAPSALSKLHDLSKFSCGKPPLDDWLRQRALKAEGTTARTYVVCNGYTAISDPETGEVLAEQIVVNDYCIVCTGRRYVKSTQMMGQTHMLAIAVAKRESN